MAVALVWAAALAATPQLAHAQSTAPTCTGSAGCLNPTEWATNLCQWFCFNQAIIDLDGWSGYPVSLEDVNLLRDRTSVSAAGCLLTRAHAASCTTVAALSVLALAHLRCCAVDRRTLASSQPSQASRGPR